MVSCPLSSPLQGCLDVLFNGPVDAISFLCKSMAVSHRSIVCSTSLFIYLDKFKLMEEYVPKCEYILKQ